MASNVAAVGRALEGLKLTDWEQPPTVVDGFVHADSGRGFSFDYPAGWTVYYPEGSMLDGSVLTIASAPLAPPSCPAASSCGGFITPPGGFAVAFSIGGGGRSDAHQLEQGYDKHWWPPAFGPTISGPGQGDRHGDLFVGRASRRRVGPRHQRQPARPRAASTSRRDERPDLQHSDHETVGASRPGQSWQPFKRIGSRLIR